MNKGAVITISIIATVLLIGGILVVVYRKKLFGGKEDDATMGVGNEEGQEPEGNDIDLSKGDEPFADGTDDATEAKLAAIQGIDVTQKGWRKQWRSAKRELLSLGFSRKEIKAEKKVIKQEKKAAKKAKREEKKAARKASKGKAADGSEKTIRPIAPELLNSIDFKVKAAQLKGIDCKQTANRVVYISKTLRNWNDYVSKVKQNNPAITDRELYGAVFVWAKENPNAKLAKVIAQYEGNRSTMRNCAADGTKQDEAMYQNSIGVEKGGMPNHFNNFFEEKDNINKAMFGF